MSIRRSLVVVVVALVGSVLVPLAADPPLFEDESGWRIPAGGVVVLGGFMNCATKRRLVGLLVALPWGSTASTTQRHPAHPHERSGLEWPGAGH